MKITLAEIDRTIERSSQWTRYRAAMQIMGAALRTQNDGRCLGEFFLASDAAFALQGVALLVHEVGGRKQNAKYAFPDARHWTVPVLGRQQ